MCQPKPGPRCSAHARTHLRDARATKESADAWFDVADRAFRAMDPDAAGYVEASQQRGRARDAKVKAAANYEQALREFETTPEGQQSLQEAVARLEADGDTTAAEAARQRLTEAIAAREKQTTDLAILRERQARTAAMTPAEVAHLDQVEQRYFTAQDELAEAERALAVANTDYQRLAAGARAAENAETQAYVATREAMEEVKVQAAAVAREAQRLYVEAGVSPRFAGYYAQDMVEAAAGLDTRAGYPVPAGSPGAAVPTRALRIKVKRSGPDVPKMQAAKDAAETDPGFIAANRRLGEAIAAHRDAKQAQQEIRVNETSAVLERRGVAFQAVKQARYRVEDAQRDRDAARDVARRTRAQIAAGAGLTVSSVPMGRLRDEVVRNPDGSTNAFVYQGPSEGFPDGRYVRATGVTTVHGMGAANALLLETGEQAYEREHYARTVRGAGSSVSGTNEVLLMAPQDGARPLREENVAAAGFRTFIDSSD